MGRWFASPSAAVPVGAALLLMLSGCTASGGPTIVPAGQTALQSQVPAATAEAPEASGPVLVEGAAATVTGIVDGDTVDTSLGRVRVIGIDTPERGECGYQEATDHAARVAPVGTGVTLVSPGGKDSTDRYDRLLRYVVAADGSDLGLEQISSGHAIARYDSRDGYGPHPREAAYVAADAATEPAACSTAGVPGAAPIGVNPGLPPGPPPGPDLDCADLPGPVWVGESDPHRLDGDGDGIGCG